MVNVKSNLVASLSNILPTYYELLTKKATKPCITYIESGNTQKTVGDTIEYSTINYTIKLWANDPQTIDEKAALIDTAMKELGFVRSGSNELAYNT